MASTDWNGTPVLIGSKVSYVGRQSSHVYLNIGEVVETTPKLKVKRLHQVSRYGKYVIRNVDPKIVTLEAPLLTVL